MKRAKIISLSITDETHAQIKKYAEDNHYKSVSAAITQLIWAAAKKEAQDNGEETIQSE